jgi:hypothetical protein
LKSEFNKNGATFSKIDEHRDKNTISEKRGAEANDEISAARKSTMYSSELIGSSRRHIDDGDYPFVDKDNYNKHLGLKQKN